MGGSRRGGSEEGGEEMKGKTETGQGRVGWRVLGLFDFELKNHKLVLSLCVNGCAGTMSPQRITPRTNSLQTTPPNRISFAVKSTIH